MAIEPGARLGPYEVVSSIGEGGMGEVFRARDTKLGRDVALKTLPVAFAHDADRLARFKREATVLASLNHPNIAAIYGFEESTSGPALVLELVEGPTLADLLVAGPLPSAQAFAIARQIADALEGAHEHGIIHRDLKPANVKVRPDGTVKVLDFGLAKAMEPGSSAHADLLTSPTITSPAMTGMGVILGTAAYMSPEQAAGQALDKRADIWAFGVVLWEMLTGRRLFDGGETVSHVLADVLRADIPHATLPPTTPPPIRELLRRCLQRDVKARLRDIGEARIVIGECLANPSGAHMVAPTVRRGSSPAIQWAAVGVAAIALAAAATIAFIHFRERAPQERTMRFQISPPDATNADVVQFSPDGHSLALVAGGRLWIRALDSLTGRSLPGTDGASFPFWSPDGAYLAFFAQGKLKKIAVGGGPAQTLCDASAGRGGTWSQDGVIVFAPGSSGALHRLSAAGGTSTPITKTSGSHRYPHFLPDGRHFLYLAREGPETRGVSLGSLDGAPPVRLFPDDSDAIYAASPNGGSSAAVPGYILFVRQTTLMVVGFDPVSLTTRGEPFPLAEQVGTMAGTGFGQFSASTNGALAYANVTQGRREFIWTDRTGKQVGQRIQAGDWPDFRLSRDDQRIVFSTFEAGNQDIWIRDLARGIRARLSFDAAQDNLPIWSPDGLRVLWPSNRGSGSYNLYIKSANGDGQETVLLKLGTPTGWATDWSRDGRFILYQIPAAMTGQDLWIAPRGDGQKDVDEKPYPYLQGQFDEQNGAFSPDGRWVAYSSNESGVDEVYVQSFPASGGRWQVSTGGGITPRWKGDGSELFYIAADRNLMAVPVRAAGASFEPGTPSRLFTVPPIQGIVNRDEYAISADGTRVLLSVPAGDTAASLVTVVLNWQHAIQK
jgi:eukaryotic-like serine/threonine-protein kinase